MRNEFAALLVALLSCESSAAIRAEAPTSDPPLAPSLQASRRTAATAPAVGGAIQWRADVIDASHERHEFPVGRTGFKLPDFGNWSCEVGGVTDLVRAQLAFESVLLSCVNERGEAVVSGAVCPISTDSTTHATLSIAGLGGRATIDLHCDPVR